MSKKSLSDLAAKYDTDKGIHKSPTRDTFGHGYTQIYEKFFEHLVDKEIKLLEIGVLYGSSLKMWNEYFSRGRIYGVDLFGGRISPEIKKEIEIDMGSKGIEIMQADQHYREELQKVIDNFGSDYDIIIDDGSHWNDDIRITLGFLFKHVKPGGFYIVEDAHWGEHKNKAKKNQTPESFIRHPHRVTSITHLAASWRAIGKFECPLMFKEEREYLCNNVKTWGSAAGAFAGKINIIQKL